jgi:hypothetical protein
MLDRQALLFAVSRTYCPQLRAIIEQCAPNLLAPKLQVAIIGLPHLNRFRHSANYFRVLNRAYR